MKIPMEEARSIEVVANDIHYIRRDVEEIKSKLEKEYVTQDQFDPIKKIVYGLVSVILTTVVVGLLMIVVKN